MTPTQARAPSSKKARIGMCSCVAYVTLSSFSTWAAWQGHLDVVEWLLQDRDASVLIRDGQGNTALDYALAGRHTKVRE